jgi:spermidine/putrescine transport system permease protein
VYSFNATDSVANSSRCAGTGGLEQPRRKPPALDLGGGNAGALSVATPALATARGKPFRGITVLYSIINLPLMVPEIVTAVALLIFFASIKVSTGYQGIGYVLAAHTAFCVPFAYLPIRARLESMDLTLETAAADLYASPVNAFRYVTLPLLWPGIMAGFMLAFVISLDDVVITDHIRQLARRRFNLHAGAAPPPDAGDQRGFHIFFLASMLLVTFLFMNRKVNATTSNKG